jgi:hypothetical protein
MNPFKQKPKALESCIVDLTKLASKPYNKNTVDPYTKIRIILMDGTEYESVWCGHQFSRHCDDNELRRELALIRRIEQQQQKRISSLKPISETILETTIGYEMLAVDLTSALAMSESDPTVKKALDFALLEDFDHLYRYADLLEGEQGIKAEKLIGKHVELMPGRPTIAEHRFPYDDIRPHITADAELLTKLHVGIITAAEQQTMNYYMNHGAFYDTEAGRKLYSEIAMIEEQHVSQYGSLKDTNMTWLECLLMHEYTECYSYYSCYETESDANVKALWEELFEQEVAHLHKAAELLEKYEGKQWEQVIPDGAFPNILTLKPSKEYVREVLESVRLTAVRDDYKEVDKLSDDADFFRYQNDVIKNENDEPAHKVIKTYISKNKTDYRYEEAPHPIDELRDREHDNTEIARVKK